MPLATVTDVLKRWTGADKPAVNDEALIESVADAEDLVLSKFPRIAERIDNPTHPNPLTSRTVKRIISQMVMRGYQANLDGKVSGSYSTGPFATSYAYSTPPSALIEMTSEEEAALSPDNKRGRAFMISLDNNVSGSWPVGNEYVDYYGGRFTGNDID